MASVRYEWCTLGVGNAGYSIPPHVLGISPPTAAKVAAPVTGGARPVAPAGAYFARITAIDANIIVAWGANPTADQVSGCLIPTGATELISVQPGALLSFVEMT